MQILVVVAIMALLSTFLVGAFGQSRSTANRANCDMQLKAITMALDAFRQENGHFPEQLSELTEKKYLTDATMLKCPTDHRPTGSYDDFYVLRSGRGSNELPILVCPLCASESGQSMQAFQGRYTKQFATRPAELTAASATTIKRPGKNPIAGRIGMQLRGGDTIITGVGGQAVVRFADGSESHMSGGSQIRVLESFVAGNTRAPLYTLINQKFGDVRYRVHHGSKFDVTTPTATAGALGTEFVIRSDKTGAWWLKVVESKVYVTNLDQRVIIAASQNEVNLSDPNANQDSSPVIVSTDWMTIGQQEPVETPTPTGASSSDPAPTPTPTSTTTTQIQTNSSAKNPIYKTFQKRSGHGKLSR